MHGASRWLLLGSLRKSGLFRTWGRIIPETMMAIRVYDIMEESGSALTISLELGEQGNVRKIGGGSSVWYVPWRT